MRVFLAVRPSLSPKRFYGALWYENFVPALARLGHEVIASDVDLLPASRFMHLAGHYTPEQQAIRTRVTERIVDEVRQHHRAGRLDLFLSYFYNAHFDPAAFDVIHGLGIPTVNFYCNSMYQFELVRAIAAKAQFSWYPERAARALYLGAGATPVRVQLGADPDIYHPVSDVEREARACFVGQRYADRDRWLAALVRSGIAVDIYGTGWPTARDAAAVQQPGEADSPVPGSLRAYLGAMSGNIARQGWLAGTRRSWVQALYALHGRWLRRALVGHCRGRAASLPAVFGRYEVALNFSNVWADGRPGSQLIPHLRLRDFEAPMCRACYLTGATEELAEFYEVGKEVDTYGSTAELIDKVRHYLAHPEAAERLRDAGYRRARRDHTWDCRFRELFGKIGLAKNR